MQKYILIASLGIFAACSTPKKEEAPAVSAGLEEQAQANVAEPAPIKNPKNTKDSVIAGFIGTPKEETTHTTEPTRANSGGLIPPKSETWKLVKGRLQGANVFGHASVISKSKNKKGNGTTTETCYRYATFAVVEMRSTDEVGAAELTIRHEPPKGFALCQPEFRGKTSNLRIGEGYFAGVAAGLIMVDGADSTEGSTEFQLFDTQSGLEIMKSFHHPTEEFAINKIGDAVTVDFFAKLPVKCELAQDGETCWKRVLSENKVVGKTPMPDCAGIFDKTKTPRTEPALVFTRARVAKLGAAPKFLGGKATCQPAP